MPRIGGSRQDGQSPFQTMTLPEVDSTQTWMLPDSAMNAPTPEQDYTVDFGTQQDAAPSSFVMRNGELVEDQELPSPEDEDNLAVLMSEDELTKLGGDIIEDVDRDITNRGPWRRRFEHGLAMMGLIEDDLDDGAFPGASNVIHPLLAEAITQFWARALGELFPPEGPAKGKVYGKQSQQALERASRVSEYLNYEMMEEDEGYDDESSRILFNLPLAGNAFRKTFRDPLLGHDVGIFVSVDDLIVPCDASSLQTTPRFTHRMRKHPIEVKRLIHSGFYRDTELLPPQPGETDEAKEIKDETSDIEADDISEDAVYEIYETCIDLDLEIDPFMDEEGHRLEIPRPYYVTIEKASRTVLSIRRGWRANDPQCRRRVPFTKYGFVPGFGFYDFGLLHLIGGLQGAATGALRVLLDSAAAASLSGGFVSSDSGIKGDSITMSPGEWKKVKATSADLQKAFYPAPVRDPSPALFNLLGLLIEGGKSFASTTEAMIGNSDGKNVAVGTITKLIEQGEKVMSAIHRRAFKSVKHELKIRFEDARENIPADGYPYEIDGDKRALYAEDFADGVAVVPVADPNIFSSAQRLGIAQMVYETSQQNPDVVSKKKAIRRLYEAARVPDIDDLITPDVDPMPYDPAGEIQAILLGKPVLVIPEQPHPEHLKVLASFAANPEFGGNPQVQMQVGPSLISVIGQHLAYAWVTANRQMGIEANYMDPETGQMQPPQVPPEQIAAAMAQIAPQLAQAPGFPNPGAGEEGGEGQDKGQAELAIKSQEAEIKGQAKMAEIAMKREAHEAEMAMKFEKMQLEMEGLKAKIDAKVEEIKANSQTKMIESQVKLEAAQRQADTDRMIQENQASADMQAAENDRIMSSQRSAMEMENMERESALKAEQEALNAAQSFAPEPQQPAASRRGRKGRSNGPV